jgi:Zn-dependent M28 family amino/carboxypeptidase
MRRIHASLTLFFVSLAGVLPLLRAADQLHYFLATPPEIEQRLKDHKGNDTKREAILKALFETVGCSGQQIIEQPVKGLKQPNIICTLPGAAESQIVVGAHYDHVDFGEGVVDNWSGASLLPSLYQSLKSDPRHHTFVFVSFSGEEKGLVGSRFYVATLPKESLSRIQAMVTMDTLALGPTAVWVSRSDKDLVQALNTTAYSLMLPLKGVNVEKVGQSDEEPFIERHVRTITIHSLTQETLSILHSPRDNYDAVHFDDYYQSYRLIAAYLAFLDQDLPTTIPVDPSRK